MTATSRRWLGAVAVAFLAGVAAGAAAGLAVPGPQAEPPAPPRPEPSEFFRAVDPDRLYRVCQRLDCAKSVFSSAGWLGLGREVVGGRDAVVKDFKLVANPARLADGHVMPSLPDVLRGVRAELEDALALKSGTIQGRIREQTERGEVVGFRFEYTPGRAGSALVRGEVEVTSKLQENDLIITGVVREYRP